MYIGEDYPQWGGDTHPPFILADICLTNNPYNSSLILFFEIGFINVSERPGKTFAGGHLSRGYIWHVLDATAGTTQMLVSGSLALKHLEQLSEHFSGS